MARRRSADADPVVEEQIRGRVGRGARRPGYRSGAYGVTYWTGGYYLSPEQFGYTTAQASGGSGGGQITTTGSADGGGGDGGGASA